VCVFSDGSGLGIIRQDMFSMQKSCLKWFWLHSDTDLNAVCFYILLVVWESHSRCWIDYDSVWGAQAHPWWISPWEGNGAHGIGDIGGEDEVRFRGEAHHALGNHHVQQLGVWRLEVGVWASGTSMAWGWRWRLGGLLLQLRRGEGVGELAGDDLQRWGSLLLLLLLPLPSPSSLLPLLSFLSSSPLLSLYSNLSEKWVRGRERAGGVCEGGGQTCGSRVVLCG